MENREAIKVFKERIDLAMGDGYADQIPEYIEAMQMAISALEKQEQACDTCRHGRFGDRQCDNCGVRYPNHYEAEEEA